MRKSKSPGTRFVVTESDMINAYKILEDQPQDIGVDTDVLLEIAYSSKELRRRLYAEGASEESLTYLDMLLISMLLTGVEIGLDVFTLKSKLVIDKDESK